MTTWTLDDIPWQRFDRSKVRPDVLAVAKAAALVERNASDYAAYLRRVFDGDEAFDAAVDQWAQEETRHGLALGRWAEMADPTFSFEAAFRQFVAGYRIPVDATTSIRGSCTGELVARCVVESGTSSFYSAMREAAGEPVLAEICRRIAADEFRHYKLFYDTLNRYAAAEGLPRWRRLLVALGRFRETEDDELSFAYHCANLGGRPYDRKVANDAYYRRAFSAYRFEHLQRAFRMIAHAAGLNPQGRLTAVITKLAWRYSRWRIRRLQGAAA